MFDTDVAKTGLSIVLTRVFNAPVAAVWSAWTAPDAMAKWWGPHGMTASATLDVRSGGAFAVTMHAADGTDYPLTGEYLDVVENRYLVMEMHLDDHPASWHDYLAEEVTKAGGAEDVPPSLTVVTRVTFEAQGAGQTRLTVEQVYASAADRDAFEATGSVQGWSQSFEKLDRVLA
ncbi:SRPBCC family protein [Asticcacaulis solisilvae]|uniref:SRPBCC family protein n=1 Tax=Asticcacaulis solisilvae TaxID=1217274 RepID=UPI003FD8AF4B